MRTAVFDGDGVRLTSHRSGEGNSHVGVGRQFLVHAVRQIHRECAASGGGVGGVFELLPRNRRSSNRRRSGAADSTGGGDGAR